MLVNFKRFGALLARICKSTHTTAVGYVVSNNRIELLR